MTTYKVLLVDDEEEVRNAIEQRINWEELGFEVIGKAQNGVKAMEIAEKLQPEVINKNIKMPPKRRMGPPGRGMAPVEKAKDFKGSIGKLIRYIGSYKIAIIFVAVMAVCSTVFSVVGPKVLGKATTALSEGLVKKIGGTGGIDFGKIGTILIFVLCLYAASAVFNFVQGWIMTGITQKVCY